MQRLLLLSVTALCLSASAIAQQVKGGEETLFGDGPVAPNLFGYEVIDSTSPMCPFDLVDISGTGNALTFTASGGFPAQDDGGADVALAEPFELFGVPYTELVVSSNGYLAMGVDITLDSGGDFSNDILPTVPDNPPSVPQRIMTYHDDLAGDGVPGVAFEQFFASCPRVGPFGDEACTIVSWTSWGFFGSADTFDFQSVLYHTSNTAVSQIGAGDTSEGASGTFGLQDETATDAVEFSANGVPVPVPGGTSICFIPPQPLPPPVVPALSRSGLTILAMLMALLGFVGVRRYIA